jgi:type IV secretion system protein VirB1
MPITANIMACPNIPVPMEIMQRLVSVESARNPFAIGVVGGQLERQPENVAEAIATANMLESQGYNFSVGISQVNRYNFTKYGLTSYEKAFDTCANLSAGALILSDCYSLAGGDWGKSFSCYYSGNFTKGFEDGYVQKIYNAMPAAPAATPVFAQAQPITVLPASASQIRSVAASESPAQYRARIRSSAIDSMTSTIVARSLPMGPPPAATPLPGSVLPSSQASANPSVSQADVPGQTGAFVPQVRGPNDAAAPANPPTQSAKTSVDRADLRLGAADEAFVF